MSAKGGQEREQILDILKEAELSMGDQVSQYKRAAEEYRDYIETWVHEVKTPLATAKVILENHKEEPLAKSGMDVEIDRIEGFVEQALYYSRSMAVENDYFIRQIDIGKIIRSEIGRRKKRFRLLGALVEVEVADPDTEEVHRGAAGRSIRSDEKWIGFVIGQILDNSLKYAKENESLKLHIFISEENERVCLNIRDNGIGMKASEIGRAFEKGFTGTNGRAARTSTGIGLYLCKKLCNRLEHDIRIESEEGNGTTVVIVF
ncbi:MAG: sensor histidine kinase [Lachnospiraceae bacterium]|nr:sensor histidine kinase [Lachnospiraceae bacterium]